MKTDELKKKIVLLITIGIVIGLLWVFYPGLMDIMDKKEESLKPTPSVTESVPVPTVTILPEVIPTDNEISIVLDYQRGFIPRNLPETGNELIISPGDEVFWYNEGKVPVTLVTDDMPEFGERLLDFNKRTSYIFDKPGNYTFYFKEYEKLRGTIVVKTKP